MRSIPLTFSSCLRLALLAGALVPVCVRAQTVYMNETFDGYLSGATPTALRASQVTVAAGTGAIGADNVAHFYDNTNAAGALEYNVGDAKVGTLYISFDLLNLNPNNTGSAANPVIFGVGPWNDSSGTLQLGANANRAFGLEFYASGSSSTLKFRVGGSSVLNTTYAMSDLQSVQIWVNDHDSTTLSFTRPDTGLGETLSANSFIVFINGSLIGTGAYAMNTTEGNPGNTTGDATLGRIGFDSSTANTGIDFAIDNLYVASAAAAVVPEPSTYALLAGAACFGVVVMIRRRRNV